LGLNMANNARELMVEAINQEDEALARRAMLMGATAGAIYGDIDTEIRRMGIISGIVNGAKAIASNPIVQGAAKAAGKAALNSVAGAMRQRRRRREFGLSSIVNGAKAIASNPIVQGAAKAAGKAALNSVAGAMRERQLFDGMKNLERRAELSAVRNQVNHRKLKRKLLLGMLASAVAPTLIKGGIGLAKSLIGGRDLEEMSKNLSEKHRKLLLGLLASAVAPTLIKGGIGLAKSLMGRRNLSNYEAYNTGYQLNELGRSLIQYSYTPEGGRKLFGLSTIVNGVKAVASNPLVQGAAKAAGKAALNSVAGAMRQLGVVDVMKNAAWQAGKAALGSVAGSMRDRRLSRRELYKIGALLSNNGNALMASATQ